MANDNENIIIKIGDIGGKDTIKTLRNLNEKIEETTSLLKNVGYGAKEMKTLETAFKNLTSLVSKYTDSIKKLNNANSDAFKKEQQHARELDKTAKSHISVATAAKRDELAKKSLELANVRLQTAIERKARADEREAEAMQKKLSPLSQLTTALKNQERVIKDGLVSNKLHGNALAMSVDKYKRLSSQLTAVNARFNSLTAVEQTTLKTTEMLNRSLAYFLGNVAANAFNNLVYGMRDFTVACSQAGIELDGIRNTFAAGARGWKQGGDEMSYVAEMADRLGLNLQSTYEPYAKFMTSFVRSGGTIAQSRQIFEDMSTAMVALHLPAERMEGVFVALEQMANKGTVQAEELKRQLSNALPGAFELAAESMGILPSQLMDLMKKGEVVSKDFLPNFAATVKDALGKQIGIAVNQFNAQMNRLQSQTFLFQANLGQLFNNAVTPLVVGLTALLRGFNGLSGSLAENTAVVTAFQIGMVATVGYVTKLIVNLPMVQAGLAGIRAEIMAINVQTGILNGLINVIKGNALVIGITALAGAVLYCYNSITQLNRGFEETAVQQRDVTNNVVGLVSEYTQLAEIQNRNVAQQEAYNRLTETLKTDYPTILDYINTHHINIKNLTQEQANQIANMSIQQKLMEAEKLKTEELNNGWTKFITIMRGVGQTILSVAKAVLHLTTAFDALFTSAGRSNFIGGFKNIISSHKKALEEINKDSKKSAEQRYKDTLAILGSEQTKLAQALMQSSSAVVGLHGASGKGSVKKGKTTKTGSKKTKTAKTTTKTSWDILQEDIKKTEELIRVGLLAGQNVDNLIVKYSQLKQKQNEVNTVIQNLNLTPYERLKNTVEELEKKYKSMLLNSSQYSAQQISSVQKQLRAAKTQLGYADIITKREDLIKTTKESARQLSNTFIDALFDDSDSSISEKLKDVGKSFAKSIAASFTKTLTDSLAAGFQAGFANTTGNIFKRLMGGISGSGSGLMKFALGTNTSGTTGTNTTSATGAGTMLNMAQQGTTLAQTLQNQVVPAVTSTSSSISQMSSPISSAINGLIGTVSPATQMSSSIMGIATSAPTAGLGMGIMSASMVALAPAATMAAPALVTMGGALATIGANASFAATSMAALAVATAANSVAGIPIAGAVLAPIAALATGGAIAAATTLTGAAIGASSIMAGAGQMFGGTMSGIGNTISGGLGKIIPHAKGGVVTSPTTFPMSGGNIGLAGEAGTEVIAPARRMSNGDLGVGAVAPNVVVNNYANAAVEVIRRPNNETEVKITELNAMLSSSRTNRGFANAQTRMSTKGRQIG